MSETQRIHVSHGARDAEDSPGAPGLAWLAQEPSTTRYRTVYGGTDAMREAGELFLPRFPREDEEAYSNRLSQAVLFNATRKTARGLTGLVYRKPVTLGDDIPAAILPHLENIDLAGRHLDVFAQDVFEDKMAGHAHIFVDWHGPEGARTQAEEEEGEARPYWIHIRKEQVLRFRAENGRGNTVLTSFAYLEGETVQDGEFREKEIDRVRQYDLVEDAPGGPRVRFRSWIRDAGTDGKFEPEEEGRLLGNRMTEIPLVTDYGNRTGYMMSNPVLDDLVHENVRHYQIRSDRDRGIHAVLHEVFVTKGVDSGKIATFAMGASTGLALPEPTMDAFYVGATGNGLEAAAGELDAIERRMAALGLAVLVRQDRTQRTATESEREGVEQDSDLARMARNHGDALENALKFHAMWMGMGEDGGGSVEINKEFQRSAPTPQMVQAVSALVPDKLSIDTLWEWLQEGSVLPRTFDPEVEHSRLAASGEAELMAILEMRRAAPPANPNGDGGDGDDGE